MNRNIVLLLLQTIFQQFTESCSYKNENNAVHLDEIQSKVLLGNIHQIPRY